MQLSYEFVKPEAEAPPVYAKDSKDSKNVMQPVAETLVDLAADALGHHADGRREQRV